ncbi:hypothetical protein [Streptomyces sp. NPDC058861]|uniref:hypothetical protein n=1 Tax=Streptomyces sp. NPDC058861 TaxID=3346653 RepID=UPI0036C33709
MATMPADRHLGVLTALGSGLELDHRHHEQLITARHSRQPTNTSERRSPTEPQLRGVAAP